MNTHIKRKTKNRDVIFFVICLFSLFVFTKDHSLGKKNFANNKNKLDNNKKKKKKQHNTNTKILTNTYTHTYKCTHTAIKINQSRQYEK